MENSRQITLTGQSYTYEVGFLSENAFLVTFRPGVIDESLNQFIISLSRALHASPFTGFIEAVPAYHSIAVYFDFLVVYRAWGKEMKLFFEKILISHIDLLTQFNPEDSTPEIKEIPVRYDGDDLAELAAYTGLAETEVIRLHTEPLYRVYFIGFLPGFAYMGGLNPALAMPRRSTPRFEVKPGSVGIAGLQTGIYPVASPGGWQLIGHTDVPLFSPYATPVTYLQAGDYVRFKAT